MARPICHDADGNAYAQPYGRSIVATGGDPRVYFAAERTVLAWLRTGLTLMGFGFVVARFGLFLSMIEPQRSATHPVSSVLGVGLVLLAVFTIAMSAIQHRRFVAALPPADVPAQISSTLPLFIAWALAALGLVLAVYLAV
jgi:putative membrane protein